MKKIDNMDKLFIDLNKKIGEYRWLKSDGIWI